MKQDGINFKNVYLDSSLKYGDTISPVVNGEKIVNAVDIDWNDAQLPNSDPNSGSGMSINSTGELLNLIDSIQQEIYVLTAAVIALSNK